MKEKHCLINEEDALDIITEWKTEIYPTLNRVVLSLSKQLTNLRENKGYASISEESFKKVYQLADPYTNVFPKIITNIDYFKHDSRYTLSDNTFQQMCTIAEEAKQWKKKFRKLKKEYEFENHMYRMTHYASWCHGELVDISENGIIIDYSEN